MKFFAVLAVAGLAVAMPQAKGGLSSGLTSMLGGLGITIPNIPSCATPCLSTMFKETGCSLNSQVAGCVCKAPQLKTTATGCIPQSCTVASEAKTFVATMNDMCKGKPGFTGL